jgi:hypothetical protein
MWMALFTVTHMQDRLEQWYEILRGLHCSFYCLSTTCSLPTVAEAIAIREGLSLANHMGCTNVIMESDSIEIVDACNGTEAW